MPSIRWQHAYNDVRASVKIALAASVLSLKEILVRVLTPWKSRDLALREAIARAWIGSAFASVSALLYSPPANNHAQRIADKDVELYLIPDDDGVVLQPTDADIVVLFAHGGGMMIGHPLQYLEDYQRWMKKAAILNLKLAFVAFKYPLSPEQKWPAQRVAMLAAHKWLLDQGVLGRKIIFAGDSAGANLVLLSLLHVRDQATSLQMPAGAVLMSPWIDMTGAETITSPNAANDFMFAYPQIVPLMNDALRPPHLPFDTPEISALLAADVGRLPPQLVIYSPSEHLATDSERWISRSRQAGVDISVHSPTGQMHTFAVGWPISSGSVLEEADRSFLKFLQLHAT